jgi:DNA-directed RNA polymerase specialized sigma24 family protein
LRGIEQESYKAIAAQLGEDAAVLAVRYQRALAKLRRELPGSIFDEFSSDDPSG